MLAYSTRGLTKVKYALSFKDVASILRFRLKNLIVLFAFSQMLLICWSHFRSLVRVSPRYLADLTLVSVWSCSL